MVLVTISSLPRVIGHSHINTTKIYAKPSIEMLRKTIESKNESSIEPKWGNEDEIVMMFSLR